MKICAKRDEEGEREREKREKGRWEELNRGRVIST